MYVFFCPVVLNLSLLTLGMLVVITQPICAEFNVPYVTYLCRYLICPAFGQKQGTQVVFLIGREDPNYLLNNFITGKKAVTYSKHRRRLPHRYRETPLLQQYHHVLALLLLHLPACRVLKNETNLRCNSEQT